MVRQGAPYMLVMLAYSIACTVIANAFDDDMLKHRMENLLEWHIGLLMPMWYLSQTAVWRKVLHRNQFRLKTVLAPQSKNCHPERSEGPVFYR